MITKEQLALLRAIIQFKDINEYYKDMLGLVAEIERLYEGIEKYLEPEGHDRCWRDLILLFNLIGKEAPTQLLTLPPREEFLGECARYHENLACGTEKWETVAELKEQVEELKADNRQLQIENEKLEADIHSLELTGHKND